MRAAFSSVAHVHRHTDLIGVTASTVCLIHCLATPIAISLFPNIILYLPGDASFHRILASAVILLGVAAFIPGYRIHRRKRLLALVVTGMLLILTVAWLGQHLNQALELSLSIPGSMLLITAHLLNRSFCRQCTTCTEHPETCHTTQVE
jgi:hypothetical protein